MPYVQYIGGPQADKNSALAKLAELLELCGWDIEVLPSTIVIGTPDGFWAPFSPALEQSWKVYSPVTGCTFIIDTRPDGWDPGSCSVVELGPNPSSAVLHQAVVSALVNPNLDNPTESLGTNTTMIPYSQFVDFPQHNAPTLITIGNALRTTTPTHSFGGGYLCTSQQLNEAGDKFQVLIYDDVNWWFEGNLSRIKYGNSITSYPHPIHTIPLNTSSHYFIPGDLTPYKFYGSQHRMFLTYDNTVFGNRPVHYASILEPLDADIAIVAFAGYFGGGFREIASSENIIGAWSYIDGEYNVGNFEGHINVLRTLGLSETDIVWEDDNQQMLEAYLIFKTSLDSSFRLLGQFPDIIIGHKIYSTVDSLFNWHGLDWYNYTPNYQYPLFIRG